MTRAAAQKFRPVGIVRQRILDRLEPVKKRQDHECVSHIVQRALATDRMIA